MTEQELKYQDLKRKYEVLKKENERLKAEQQEKIKEIVERLEEKLSKKHKLFLREDRDELRYFYEMHMLKEVIEIVKEVGGMND